MDTQNKDYLEISRGRVTQQFKDKPNFDKVLTVWTQGYDELESTALRVLTIPDIDTASGVQLDVIGEIVGQPRDLININLAEYFGFEGDTSAFPFGSVTNNDGGIYFSLNNTLTGNVRLNDEFYRYFIKAKIIQNTATANIADIVEAAVKLFQADIVEVLDGNYAEITINLDDRTWSDPAKSVFPGVDETDIANRYLPIPAGVLVKYVDRNSTVVQESIGTWVVSAEELYNFASYTLANKLDW